MTTQYTSFSSNGGHSAKSPGACSGEYKEHEQTRLMNKAFIKAMAAREYKVTDTTSDARNKSAVLIEQVQKVNEAAKDSKHLALSWHYNGGGGTGTEVLHWGDSTKSIAAKLSAAIAKTLDVRDRGPKQREDLFFLRRTASHALILEVCFIDSPDMEKLEAKRQLVAEAVADVLVGRPSSSRDSSTKPTASSTTTAASSTQPTPSTGQTAYTGPSIVDYLKSLNADASFAARAKLAVKHGIVKRAEDYDGTLSQNTALLAAMRKAVKQ